MAARSRQADNQKVSDMMRFSLASMTPHPCYAECMVNLTSHGPTLISASSTRCPWMSMCPCCFS